MKSMNIFIIASTLAISLTACSRNTSVDAATTVVPTLGNFVATPNSETQINLSWTDESGGLSTFSVYRATDAATFTQLATLPAGTLDYADTGLSPGTTYSYKIQATASGLSSAFATASSQVASAAIWSQTTAAPKGVLYPLLLSDGTLMMQGAPMSKAWYKPLLILPAATKVGPGLSCPRCRSNVTTIA